MPNTHTLVGHGAEKVLVLPDWFGGANYMLGLEKMADVDKYTYAVVHFRGYGEARGRAGEYSISEMANDALSVADELDWKTFHVVGHSMGGKAAQLLAARHPSRLSSMVLMTPTPPINLGLDDATWKLLDQCATDEQSRAAALAAATGGQYGDHFINALARESISASCSVAFRGYLDAWAQSDITQQLSSSANAQLAVLILLGANDPFVPEDAMRTTVMHYFKSSKLIALPGIGHYPLLEAPPKTIALLEGWFANRGEAPQQNRAEQT